MFKRKRNLGIIMIIWVLTGTALSYFGFLQYKIHQYSRNTAPQNADYLIVLGARVKGTVPSLVLKERIKTAAQYLKKNEKTIAIASGGQGPGEDISEAECIKKELLKLGINESRIRVENRSTDTYENIQFSKQYIPVDGKSGVIVTNDFHLYRALMITKDHRLFASGIPAKTPLIAIPKSYSREYLAITKYYLKSIIE
jgi:uncharacterized SAM-binding protein YcdF (DUF218 family)